jgi:hypothetical protein
MNVAEGVGKTGGGIGGSRSGSGGRTISAGPTGATGAT